MVTVIIGQTKLRASKDGYATSLTDPPNATPRATVGIFLRSLSPPAIRPGKYTLSVVADSTCALPEEVRTRTYSATITLSKSEVNLPPERQTDFDVALSGASFVMGCCGGPEAISPTNSLTAHVAGDYLELLLDPYEFDGYITEWLPPATFVDLRGSVAGSVSTSAESSLPFDGRFTYCVKSSDVIPGAGGTFGCSADDPAYTSCSSKNHRVVLTPR
jgi:hypothetical protein